MALRILQTGFNDTIAPIRVPNKNPGIHRVNYLKVFTYEGTLKFTNSIRIFIEYVSAPRGSVT